MFFTNCVVLLPNLLLVLVQVGIKMKATNSWIKVIVDTARDNNVWGNFWGMF